MHIHGICDDVRAQGLGSLGAGTVGGAYQVALKKYGWVQDISDPPLRGARPPDALIFSDPDAYLKAVVDIADWTGVARWYATQINGILQRSTNPSDFWALSNRKIGNYINSSRMMTKADFAAFTRHVVLPYIVLDLGKKVGFGIAGGNYGQFGQLIAFTETSSSNGQIAWRTSADDFARYGNGKFNLGWVNQPSDHMASRIITAIGVGIMTAGAASALLPAGGAAGGGAGAAAGGSGGATAAGAASAIIPAGVETVVVTAAAPAIIGAGAAAVGAGAGIAVAAISPPPPLPQASPIIETVVTQASTLPAALAPTAVGAGIASGAIVAVATAPPIFDTGNVIETVTVTGQAPTQVQVSPAETAATGLTTIGITQPTINVPEPQLPEIEGDSLFDRIKDIAGDLGDAISSLLGNTPQGQAPVNDGSLPDWLDPTGGVKNPGLLDYLKSPLIWGPLLLVAVAAVAGKRKKVRRKRRHAHKV